MSLLRRNSAVFVLIYVVTIAISFSAAWQHFYQQQLANDQIQLDRFSSYIATQLDKYAHIPQLIAKDREVIDALIRPSNPAQLDITNRYLEEVNDVVEAADIYLLDQFGNTIAASNWHKSKTFIGKNFAFRPYFQQAIQGVGSEYFALGSTSGLRGYYYAYPVIYAADVKGVIVVKKDLSFIEDNWTNRHSYFVATDQFGIIFMASNRDWLFSSLSTLDDTRLQQIEESKQYLSRSIESLELTGDLDDHHAELVHSNAGWMHKDYLSTRQELKDHQLTIRVLSSKVQVFWSAFEIIVLISLIFTIVFLVRLLQAHQKQKQRQFDMLQAQAKQKLEFQVMERTAELQIEIGERIKTEKRLTQTQDELIQAAKLAVLGQMSASISHELNNPLAAIRSFAENGKRFISKENYQKANENLTRISGLIDRMAKISKQLRSFARKSDSGEISYCSINAPIESAVELMNPQFKAAMVLLDTQIAGEAKAQINPIQLEQVIINILANALQAVGDATPSIKHVLLTLSQTNEYHLITIEDSGLGIASNKVDQLFESFFTTKPNGLGLGLSISQEIVHAMNGHIEVGDSDLGGAKFIIQIPVSPEQQQDE